MRIVNALSKGSYMYSGVNVSLSTMSALGYASCDVNFF